MISGEHPGRTARWLWASLAPALACLWLTFVTVNQDSAGFGRKTSFAFGYEHYSRPVLQPEQNLTTQNRLESVTFEWTNPSVFNSSMAFTSPTNFRN